MFLPNLVGRTYHATVVAANEDSEPNVTNKIAETQRETLAAEADVEVEAEKRWRKVEAECSFLAVED